MPDLNLLLTLDVLLSEGSVAGAARRLGLSASAMSRALARLRQVTGDPLLVRAGRALVPTPRALALRDEVGPLVEAARVILRPAEKLDLARLERRFTLRSSEGFVETFGSKLLELTAEAPGVTLHFETKPDKDAAPLRDGTVDLETGVIDQTTAPEMRAAPLFDDHWQGALRKGHPLSEGALTPARFAAAGHILILRRGLHGAEIDQALAAEGLQRRIVTVVSGFSQAIALARQTDLVATVPARHTLGLRGDLASLTLPVAVAPFTLSMLWHPRMDGDQAHRWLRGRLRQACRSPG
ncbi:MAG: LysR family transcriptional regulator [Cypionkella sp.]